MKWEKLEKKKVAEAAGLNSQRICDYISGRKIPSRKTAQDLDESSLIILGKKRHISAAAWMRLVEHDLLK